MTEKKCSACQNTLNIDQFGKTKRDGYRPYCRPCDRQKNRERYAIRKLDPAWRELRNAKHREHLRRNPRSYERRKKEWLKSLYKMSPEDYDNLLASQNGVCAICLQLCKTDRGLSIDHDHSCCPGNKSCGKCIRGLLCSNCNRAIGMLQEDITIITRAIEYLTSPPKLDTMNT